MTGLQVQMSTLRGHMASAEGPATTSERAPLQRRDKPPWAQRYLILALAADAIGLVVAGAVAQYVRFGDQTPRS